MPSVYLSPSTQHANLYVTGGSEAYHMNRLTDALVPWLRSSGVTYSRNTPDMTAASSIRASNAGDYGLHLALHSNAAPEGRYGQARGGIAFYYPGSAEGRRAAEIFANNLKAIYPLPNLVRAEATTRIGEVRQTRAPSVLLEVAYHDNVEDANWITGNIEAIARNVALSVTEFFGVPLIAPGPEYIGIVTTPGGGALNIRSRPAPNAPVLAQAMSGAQLIVTGRNGDWFAVDFGGEGGYVWAEYVRLQ